MPNLILPLLSLASISTTSRICTRPHIRLDQTTQAHSEGCGKARLGPTCARHCEQLGTKRLTDTVQPMMTTKADEATSVEEKPFRFLDLPSELRCLVYDYLLANRCEIDLTCDSGKLEMKPSRWRKIYPSIIFVNKEIHKEAIPILYSGNYFYGQHASNITYLLTHCGSSAKHLRHIGLRFHTGKNYMKTMVQKLKVAKDLTTLALPWEMVREHTTESHCYSRSSLAKELAPVYKDWKEQQANDTEKKARSLEEVLEIQHGWQPLMSPDELMLCQREAKKLEVKVREELKKILGGD